MALEPRDVMSEVSDRARRTGTGDPPSLLHRSAEAPAPLPSIQQGEELATVHREWARVHATGDELPEGGSPGGGVRAKMRAKVVTAAAEAALLAQQQDRALIGDLIRATDALARRIDDVAGRLAHLEGLVQEVVDVVSEDLVQLRAAVSRPERTGRDVPADG